MIKASYAAWLHRASCHEMFQGPKPNLSYKPDREERCSTEQVLKSPTYQKMWLAALRTWI
ncbi:hypothetical protein BDA96_10G206100 [Sorghum bicolor]|uniref:Uncharacterized protein n=1 Tax=Sorghum bicolor TaxID=4558 RepID=A0A921Q2X2_SORBI|nr:hypothetical protein BDA96_10G206100 [Sorghum bicolor]